MIALHAWFGYDLPLRERFRLIAEAGFDAVMLWWSEDPDFANYPGKEYADQVKFAQQTGLFVENIHAPFWEMNHFWEDTAAGQAIFEYLLRSLDDCKSFQIPTMVLHASCGEAPPVSDIGLLRFARLIERAERNDVTIALENMRRASQIQQTDFLLGRFDAPRLGVCFDSGHYHIRLLRTAQADFLSRFGHRLMALHLHDNEGCVASENSVDQHRLPFDGTIDWPAQMRAVAATGYAGPTALEVVNLGYEALPPEEFLALAHERAVRLEQFRKDTAGRVK